MFNEDNVHRIITCDKAKPKVRRKIIAVLVWLAVLAVISCVSFYFLWGYINPGWNFKAFDDKLPTNFNNTLRILKDTVYSKNNELVKWVNPIRIVCEGDPDETDKQVLQQICEEFNTIPGFPGISIVKNEKADASIIFATKDNHAQLQSSMGTTDTSVCRLNYSDIIRSADILIEPGGGRGYRNTVILHECFHMLGFMGHTSYFKSIVNDKLPVTKLCAADKLAFMVIYYPEIKQGTTYNDLVELSKQYTVAEFAQMSDASGIIQT